MVCDVNLRSRRSCEVCVVNGSSHEDIVHARIRDIANVSGLVPSNVGKTPNDFTSIFAFWSKLKRKPHSYIAWSDAHVRVNHKNPHITLRLVTISYCYDENTPGKFDYDYKQWVSKLYYT